MAVPLSYMVSHLLPYPKPKAPQSQITFLLTYSIQTYVFDSDRTSMTKWVLEVWSVRRFRAWRRGLMQPIWQVMSRICPLQRPFHNKVQRVGEPQVTTSHR